MVESTTYVHTLLISISDSFNTSKNFASLDWCTLVVLLTSRFSCCLTLQLFRDSVHTINFTKGNLLNSYGWVFSWMPISPCQIPPTCFHYHTQFLKFQFLEFISMLYFKTLSFETTTTKVIGGLTGDSKNVFLYASIRRNLISAKLFLLFLVSRTFHAFLDSHFESKNKHFFSQFGWLLALEKHQYFVIYDNKKEYLFG